MLKIVAPTFIFGCCAFANECNFNASILDISSKNSLSALVFDSVDSKKSKSYFRVIDSSKVKVIDGFVADFYFDSGDTVLLFGNMDDTLCGFYFLKFSQQRIYFPLGKPGDLKKTINDFKLIKDGQAFSNSNAEYQYLLERKRLQLERKGLVRGKKLHKNDGK